jgi:hypothetical protein
MLDERQDDSYTDLPWYVRAIIRLIIVLLNLIHPILKKHEVAPVFALYDLAEEEIGFLEEDDDQEFIQ